MIFDTTHCVQGIDELIFLADFYKYMTELCPFFDSCIVNIWNLVNKISGELFELGHGIWLTECVQGVHDLINFWQILLTFG